MDIKPADVIKADKHIQAAVKEIEKCVHCGFCSSACPTYGLEQNELDSPRGRIYLVKQLIEQQSDPKLVQHHLDRCLTCRACETACPSGVGYSKIAHAGRMHSDKLHRRSKSKRLKRFIFSEFARSSTATKLGRAAARIAGPLLPQQLKASTVASLVDKLNPSIKKHSRTVSIVGGCAQKGLMPSNNKSLVILLDAIGYNARFVNTKCCGALRMHAGREKQALNDIRRTLKSLHEGIKKNDEAIFVAASGCASFLTEYPAMLVEDKVNSKIAKEVIEKVIDPAQFFLDHIDDLKPKFKDNFVGKKIVAHVPCTLINGLNSANAFPDLLREIGFEISTPTDLPNCCGSAGIYSTLQPNYAKKLRTKMAQSIASTAATSVATANIGCALHLRGATSLPVHHWLDIAASSLDI